MTSPQLFLSAMAIAALLHVPIRQPVLAAAITVVALTLYELTTMLSAAYPGGGASMWPIAMFFVVVFSMAGAAFGVFLVSAVRKRKQ